MANGKDVFLVTDEFHADNVEEIMFLSHFVNRLDSSLNDNERFHVGNEHHVEDEFNVKLKL